MSFYCIAADAGFESYRGFYFSLCDSVIIRVGSVFIYFFISFIRVSDRARVSTGSAQLCEIFVGIAKSRKSARA